MKPRLPRVNADHGQFSSMLEAVCNQEIKNQKSIPAGKKALSWFTMICRKELRKPFSPNWICCSTQEGDYAGRRDLSPV
jgi:hypothetical protein